MQKSVPYKLSIRIEADGFSFVLTQNGKLLLKRQLWCNKNELVNKLVAELQLQNLSDKLFDQVEVIIHSPKAQLIPQEINTFSCVTCKISKCCYCIGHILIRHIITEVI